MEKSVDWWSRSACSPESEGYLRELTSGINGNAVKEWECYTTRYSEAHVIGCINECGMLVGEILSMG